MKKFPKILMFLILAVFLVAGNVWAIPYAGSISSSDSSMIASVEWARGNGSTLLWDVDYSEADGLWTYAYTLTVATDPNISHVIIEVSETFDESNIKGGTLDSLEGPPKLYNGQGGSNPGILPVGLWGIKWEPFEDLNYFSWTIVSDRDPMWGDFYAKGGDSDYAYNSGFGIDTFAAIGNGNALDNGHAWVLVPDTTSVPEPATMLLLGSGLIGLAALGRKKLFKKS